MTGAPIQDIDRVTLRSEQVSRSGTRVPAGSTGTVVAVLKGGEAYMVEFMRPVEAVVTVEPGDLTPAKPCENFAGLAPPNPREIFTGVAAIPAVEDLQNVRTFRGAPRPALRSNPR